MVELSVFLSLQSYGIEATPANANSTEPHPQGGAVQETAAADFGSFSWFGTEQAQTADMFQTVRNYAEVFGI